MRLSIDCLKLVLPQTASPLFDDLSLDFEHGSITALFGPNGVGKSTLLRLIANLPVQGLHNSASAIRFDKGETSPYIAVVPQDYSSSLFPWLSIDSNILVPLQVRTSLSKPDAVAVLGKLKSKFPYDFGLRYPAFVSGGQRQTCALLRSLIVLPDLLCLDEPFSALDTYSAATFRDEFFAYLRKERVTTVFISHQLAEAVTYADRIVFLEKYDTRGTRQYTQDLDSAHRAQVGNIAYVASLVNKLAVERGILRL